MGNVSLLITQTAQLLEKAERGHDMWHALRVQKNAQRILLQEEADADIIEAACIVHDIADDKFDLYTLQDVEKLLQSCDYSRIQIEKILEIIANISFKGGFSTSNIVTKEFAIVQDADRLDAIGAIGIARAFQYGGYKNRELYNPSVPPQTYANAEEYRNSKNHTINHFYEKLFTISQTMNTTTAKEIAAERHNFMQEYVNQFLKEWNGASL